MKNRIGGNALVTIDDYGFLLTLRPISGAAAGRLAAMLCSAKARRTIWPRRLRGSELVKWQFRGVAQTGLMVPRNLPGPEAEAEAIELELRGACSACSSNTSRIIRS